MKLKRQRKHQLNLKLGSRGNRPRTRLTRERESKPGDAPQFSPAQNTLAKKLAAFLTWPKKVIVLTSLILGCTAFYFFLPNVHVSEASGFDHAKNPTEVPLRLSNDGNLSIRIDKVLTYLDYLLTDEGQRIQTIGFGYPQAKSTLKRAEAADFAPDPPIIVSGKVLRADMIVIINYYQKFWPWRLEKRVRFTVLRGEDDKLVWTRPYMTELDRVLQPVTVLNRPRVAQRGF